MQSEDRETWFWTLSELGESSPREGELVPDEVLEAYRAGQLNEEEGQQVELLLVANSQNRRRLVELARLAPKMPSARVRRRVLEGGERSRPAWSRPVWSMRRGWLGLAAAVLGVAFGWSLLRPANTPPAYEVRIKGLVESRGPEVPDGSAVALSGTLVEIDATVVGRALKSVEVALYRAAGQRIERVPLGEGSEHHQGRSGAVKFKVPASDLVGDKPGLYEVFVVVAWQGDLPASMALEVGEDPRALLEARGRRRVHRLTLRLLAETSALPPHSSGSPPDEENQHVAQITSSDGNSFSFHLQYSCEGCLLGTLWGAMRSA